MTLFRELCQDCIGMVKMWRVIVQFHIACKRKPRHTDKTARYLVKLFNSPVTNLVDNMNTFEKVVDALKKEDEVEDDRKPWDELVNEVEHGVAISQKKLQHGEVFQHPPVTNIAKNEIIKTCKTGCCVSHRKVTENGSKAVSVVVKHYSHGKDNLFDNMLDRSWLGLDKVEDELCILVNKDNTIMSLICSVTLDLVDEYEEEMCSLAKKDNTLLFLICSVNLDLSDVVTEDQ